MSSYFDDADDYYGGGDGSDNDSNVGSDNEEEETIIPVSKKTSKPTIIIEGEEDEEVGVGEEDEEVDVVGEDEDVDEDVGEDVDDIGSIGSVEEDEEEKTASGKKLKELPKNLVYNIGDDDDQDEEDEDGELYLQKFDKEVNQNYIMDFHPECVLHNYEEISAMTTVIRDNNNIIIDPLHRTIPFLTKYEKARILGQRAKQINSGATPFVKVPENVIDGYLIAELELAEKRIPFIIRRPLPNGASEYWNIKDLEIVGF